ncbi:MAG: rRNA pseudouridine synthase [Acidobacteriia bacterium]|nr:rRNA pseudouridine synthase [Terriglobia bacterium]
MTLDRVISRHGIASRTVAAEWIHEGRVRVNSTIERHEGRWIDLKRDHVEVDDREVSSVKKVYLMLNKPANVVTSHGDPQGRRTVYDYLQGLAAWVFPVGRLDKDTSGLLLLTNDTDFGNRLTDPRSKVSKRYWAKVNAVIGDEELDRLRKGIEIEPGLVTRPCVINLLRTSEKYSWLEITLTEGRNRQIRRMVEALGRQIIKLVRVQIGSLRLGELGVGKWRELTRVEVRQLRSK